MNQSELEELAPKVEAAPATDGDLRDEVITALKNVLPGGTPTAINTVDGVLRIVDAAVPGWAIHIEGRAQEPDGHWHCQLRHSNFRDNDEFIGRGRGAVLEHALLAAVLRVYAYRLRDTAGA
ncbi:hypothetical protein ACW9UR_11535 [Halovulum sp. GXIMD14794]